VAPRGTEARISPEEMLLMRRLLAEADERCATAALYVFVDGMSHAETAKILGVSKRTVGNLIQSFRDFAAAAMEEKGPGCPDG
jgi:RNA polymerase sigma-70 factor (ECF subfamily)